MSSLIEQAAARLAQLRNAGVADPGQTTALPAVQDPIAGVVPTSDAGNASLQPSDFPGFTAAPEFPPMPEFPPVHEFPEVQLPELPAIPAAVFPSSHAASEAASAVKAQGGFFHEERSVPSAIAATAMPAATAGAASRLVQATSRRVELDLQRLAALNFVTPGSPRSRIADQYRVIKRPLIANALGKGAAPVAHGNRIMVTSALPGEGKTFTAVNLALSIAAELDTTVMLVDADVGRPSVLKTLGLAPGPGLLDVLEGRATMPEVLLRTNVDKLTLLSAGTLHDRATEVLASDGMHALLQEVAQRYDDRVIIFDSPPLLLTTEARALASHMGQVIIVVQAGQTSQSDVQTALATIEFCPVKLLLLNQARGTKLDAYATGYKYGYGYGYGQEHGDQAA
ncbi:XrtA-associated tyrosine autokinase [Azohydromonas lata]|uniref:non-specific protein-tyrosine kinase n=1 Tax=Azohydromonas lata TaxID=45677 RepID=A0ABU5IKJ1_9BURK|nr:XrtA-associated tyrosine autokinase [Azohydromonas lata]MDZ5459394.1 XrtA-associated tyrosine autokinase [Azohydromonas lata]